MGKKLCYIRGISRGGAYVTGGPETGNKYKFTSNKPCLEIGPELDERDVYNLLQKVKREMGSCSTCNKRSGKKETVYPMFAIK